jgi:hypothetical protein
MSKATAKKARKTKTLGQGVFGPVGDLIVVRDDQRFLRVETLEGKLMDEWDPGHVREAVVSAIRKSRNICEHDTQQRLAGMSRAVLMEQLMLIEKLALAAEMQTTYDGGAYDDLNPNLSAKVSRPELMALYRAARGLDPVAK